MESGCQGEPQALSGPERVQVVLHVPVPNEGVSEPEDAVPEDLSIRQQSHSEPGCVVAADTVRRPCCDAARDLMVKNGKGEPLSVGRLQRTVPWQIRKALMHRDGGCTFPGCTEQRYVDARHIIHGAYDGELIFTDPGGSVLAASFRLHPTTYTSIVDLHRRQKLGISGETALASTEWGHGMDMRMLMDRMISVSHGPNFNYPFPKPLSSEEREQKIARQQRLDALTRERFPLKRPDGTSPRRSPGSSLGGHTEQGRSIYNLRSRPSERWRSGLAALQSSSNPPPPTLDPRPSTSSVGWPTTVSWKSASALSSHPPWARSVSPLQAEISAFPIAPLLDELRSECVAQAERHGVTVDDEQAQV